MLRGTEPVVQSAEPQATPLSRAPRDSTNSDVGRIRKARIAILVKNFEYGGTQCVLLRLANKLHEYGHAVQVVTGSDGPLRSTIADGIEQVDLAPTGHLMSRWVALRSNRHAGGFLLRPAVLPVYPVKGVAFLRALATHLAATRPDVLISGTTGLNVASVLAKRRSGVDTRLILTEHVLCDQRRLDDRRWARRFMPDLMRETYRDADAIVGVSSGVAEDLRGLLHVPTDRVRCIYNPAVLDDIAERADESVEQPWFAPEQPPVVLSAGRPGRTKDFATLLHAFARVRAQMPARLVLLSSGGRGSPQVKQLDALRALAQSLRVADDFAILEFTANPFRYMARAAAFVSSSTTEGFSNVVAEALACGCPVVSTQTEGPAEVLDHGRYGRLVPVGDEIAMAKALVDVLRTPRNSAALMARASAFSQERAARAYEALCREVVFALPPEHVRAAHARPLG